MCTPLPRATNNFNQKLAHVVMLITQLQICLEKKINKWHAVYSVILQANRVGKNPVFFKIKPWVL